MLLLDPWISFLTTKHASHSHHITQSEHILLDPWVSFLTKKHASHSHHITQSEHSVTGHKPMMIVGAHFLHFVPNIPWIYIWVLHLGFIYIWVFTILLKNGLYNEMCKLTGRRTNFLFEKKITQRGAKSFHEMFDREKTW